MKHVDKPWGWFDQYSSNERSTVKILVVKPKARTSLQSHEHRKELWLALDEGLVVEIGNNKEPLKKGSTVEVEKGVKHRISCLGTQEARMLEISFGDFSEDDITRYEDDYGRLS